MRIISWLVGLFDEDNTTGEPTGGKSEAQVDDEPEPIWISSYAVEQTQEALSSFNEGGGREGLVYWAGVPDGRGGVVTTLVVPDAQATPGRVETDARENADILRWLADQEIVLLGQAHSHPPGAGNRHSQGDDEHTFSPFPGAISVIVPDYARAKVDLFEKWGVHRFLGGEYTVVPDGEKSSHLRVVQAKSDRR